MKKFETILESYINGNITWVKQQVKKLSKEQRKELYLYAEKSAVGESGFFFNLI
jgi:hypothetical protein